MIEKQSIASKKTRRGITWAAQAGDQSKRLVKEKRNSIPRGGETGEVP